MNPTCIICHSPLVPIPTDSHTFKQFECTNSSTLHRCKMSYARNQTEPFFLTSITIDAYPDPKDPSNFFMLDAFASVSQVRRIEDNMVTFDESFWCDIAYWLDQDSPILNKIKFMLVYQ